MIKVGFLLGAGASYPFGIPMMRQFYERFVDYIRTTRTHCVPLLEKLADRATNPDLEVLIQRLEKVRDMRVALEILGEGGPAIDPQIQLAEELRGYLDMFLIETCEKFDAEKAKNKLSRLALLASELGARVFTTNYDRLFEFASTSAGLSYSDGFDAHSSRPESKWNGAFSHGMRLIKLHGSVNWYEEEGSGNLFRLERGYSLPSHHYRLTHGARALRPLMIIPTLEKAVLKQPYAGLLTQFSDALNEVDVFVVIGNSLRDDHLRNTVIARMSRLNLVLVNPSSKDQLNIAERPSATHAVPLGIEQFIDFGLEPFRRLLMALDALPSEDRAAQIQNFARELEAMADQRQSMSREDSDRLLALQSGSVELQLAALTSKGRCVHPLLVDEAKNLALNATDEAVKIAAIDALVEARGPDSAQELADIVLSPAGLTVRAEAALALQGLGHDGSPAGEVLRRTVVEVGEHDIVAKLLAKPTQKR
jgi:NAD-dependent SIR2 family protein deacetylase